MIRPLSFGEFNGQRPIVEHLKIAVTSARHLKKPLGHVLFIGPPGLGKTTLGASVLAAELGVPAVIVNCGAIKRAQDIMPTVSTIKEGQILFLDEIHNLPADVKDTLLTVMEDFKLPIFIGEGDERRILTANLPPFTLVGSTTREGKLPQPFRDRFKHVLRLNLYSDLEMAGVLHWTADKLGLGIYTEAVVRLTPPCHGTARHAGRLLEACQQTMISTDPSQVAITGECVVATLKRLGYTSNGLTAQEFNLLKALRDSKTALGLSTLGALLDEENATVEEIYEPWLLKKAYIVKTTKGRVITTAGIDAIKDGDWPA